MENVFEVTDATHGIVGKAQVVMGEMLTRTVVLKGWDLVKGSVVAGNMWAFAEEAKRVVPEVAGWTNSVIRIFGGEENGNEFEVGGIADAARGGWLGGGVEKGMKEGNFKRLVLKEEGKKRQGEIEGGALYICLDLVERMVEVHGEDRYEVVKCFEKTVPALLAIVGKGKGKSKELKERLERLVVKLDNFKNMEREPMKLIVGKTALEKQVVSQTPRIDEDKNYKHSKDKGKEKNKAIRDKMVRQFKREKKAAKRELRVDGEFIERKRREETGSAREEAKAKRHKNFAWMEGEQATINQQVRQGGGLMKGGGTGAGKRAKARGMLGIKKGGNKK